jgi:hypothetical protein
MSLVQEGRRADAERVDNQEKESKPQTPYPGAGKGTVRLRFVCLSFGLSCLHVEGMAGRGLRETYDSFQNLLMYQSVTLSSIEF